MIIIDGGIGYGQVLRTTIASSVENLVILKDTYKRRERIGSANSQSKRSCRQNYNCYRK